MRISDWSSDVCSSDLKAAADDAHARGLPMHLIDRDVGVTFKRISARLGFLGRTRFVSGLLAGLFVDDEVGETEIEKLKQGDMLEASFGEFAQHSPALYDTLIAERDQYMAARLRRSEEHTSELQSLMRISYAVFCLKKKKKKNTESNTMQQIYDHSSKPSD